MRIIARGELPTTEGKLLHAGANEVVLPAHIGAERIAELILFPETSLAVVITSVLHVTTGALTFGAGVVLAIQIRYHVPG